MQVVHDNFKRGTEIKFRRTLNQKIGEMSFNKRKNKTLNRLFINPTYREANIKIRKGMKYCFSSLLVSLNLDN